MPIATLRSDSGKTRSFYVDICPVHAIYEGALWVRQGGAWEIDSTYRMTGALRLDDTMRTDRQPQQKDTAA